MNKLIYENVYHEPTHVIEFAISLQKVQKEVQPSINKDSKLLCYWKSPPPGYLKLNVDGAMFFCPRNAGVGVVLINERGDVILACSKMANEVANPKFIEALAMLRGLQLCVQWGIPKLIMKNDCLLLVNELQLSRENFLALENLLKEIQRLMKNFHECKVVHVPMSISQAI